MNILLRKEKSPANRDNPTEKRREYKLAVLFFFTALFLNLIRLDGFPALITPGTYMVPESKMDTIASMSYIADGGFLSDIDICFSPTPNLSLGLGFSYIYPKGDRGKPVPGDSNFVIKYYAGDFLNDFVSIALSSDFTIPTGPSPNRSPDYRYLSSGNHKLKLGITAALAINSLESLQIYTGYQFMGAKNENLYSGLKLNPFSIDTYTKLFGLNPFAEKSFLFPERLKDDCVDISIALISKRFYPYMMIFEIYYIRGIIRQPAESSSAVEVQGVNSLLAATEVRYQINRDCFIGLSYIYSFAGIENYPVHSTGVRFQYLM